MTVRKKTTRFEGITQVDPMTCPYQAPNHQLVDKIKIRKNSVSEKIINTKYFSDHDVLFYYD